MHSSVLKHLSVILTGNIVYNLFVIEGSPEDRSVKSKQISDIFFVYD